MADDIAIDALLSELGYGAPSARHAARAVLEAAGLTNPRKHRIHASKRELATRALDEALVGVCGATCRTLTRDDARPAVMVDARACAICGGRSVAQSLRRLVDVAQGAGVARLLVVGGGPGTQEELRAARDDRLRIDVVPGRPKPDSARLLALARNADVIVIWGSTILPHAVSDAVARPELARKTVTVVRRSIGALVDGVAEHCRKRVAHDGASALSRPRDDGGARRTARG